MMNPSRFLACMYAMLFFCSVLRAQEDCTVEVKLLLSAADTQAVITRLKLRKETTGSVYFFDTSALDLLSHGVILRLRRGANNDLTVKLRPLDGKKFFDPSDRPQGLACEADVIGGEANPSYSMRSKYVAPEIPETGDNLVRLLTAEQKKLLQAARTPIDWSRVKRMAEIKSTAWRTNGQPYADRLTVELWEWPAGKILELSARVEPGAAPSTYRELQQLAHATGLSMNADQRSKTSIVLKGLASLTK